MNKSSKTNKKYGLTESYQHDLNGAEVCKKCHKHISELKYKVCPVMGKDEVAQLRNPIAETYLGGNSDA